jgi:hypothetical protein
LRVDGAKHRLENVLFFRASGEGVTTGNAERIIRSSEQNPDVDHADVRALFGVFERELAGATAVTTLDEEAEARLRALGYVQ